MASKNDFLIGICIFSLCIMLIMSSDAAAAQDDAPAIQRRELGASGLLGKDSHTLFHVWDYGKKAYDLVNMTMADTEKIVDKQCEQNPPEYCCLVENLHLNCLRCCKGTRPEGLLLSFSASPSPSPSPLPSASPMPS